MTEDDLGAWWLATRAGLLRLAPEEMTRAFADTNHVPPYRVFDQVDGLPGVIGLTKLKVLTRSADGRIWVAADEGVASIDPRNLGQNALTLNVIVETARIDGKDMAPSDVTVIPARSSALEIDYTATALSFPSRVQFRYRLEGADHAWREVGARRRAYYTDLRPGSYVFRVSANNGDGNWIESNATWSFRVLPAWYQTLWFRALAILLIGGLGGLIVAVIQRRRHLRSRAELKRQYDIALAERVRIAEDLHDTLLQGFAGVNLQLIAAEMAIPSEPEIASATLVRVQRLAEQSLREARERVWEMRDTARATDDLAAALRTVAMDRTAGTPIEVEVTTVGDVRRLPRAVEDASFRIGREAIVNVVRHARATRMEVHLEFDQKAIRLEVRDDGRGVVPDEAADAAKRGHFGLSGIKNRASLLGGRCEVRPRPGGGTVVALELPFTEP